MKNLILGLLFIGLTNLVTAQNDLVELTVPNQVNSSGDNEISNSEYLNTFKNDIYSKKVLNLQDIVANYDIKTAKVYNKNLSTTYTVNFKSGKNQIIAIYDKNGQLLSSEENYEAIIIPYVLGSKLVKEHPEWIINETYCNIKFKKDKNVQIVYKVVIKKGNKTKTLTI